MLVAMTAIDSLAIFYNYCLPFAASNGIPRENVEKVTKDSVELRIARYLHNTEKHPATPANSSGLNPRLVDLHRYMVVAPGGHLGVRRTERRRPKWADLQQSF